MILVLDNYDSFTFNLVQYLRELGAEVRVTLNDQCSPTELLDLAPLGIVISPGPGVPADAGISMALVRAAAGRIPVLGVCLGHQSIAAAHGSRIVPARELVHGKTSEILHDGCGIFRGIPSPFLATRYHSLAVERDELPAVFAISAWTTDGEVMGIRHREVALEGVQFHPESLASEWGRELLANWLRAAGGEEAPN